MGYNIEVLVDHADSSLGIEALQMISGVQLYYEDLMLDAVWHWDSERVAVEVGGLSSTLSQIQRIPICMQLITSPVKQN